MDRAPTSIQAAWAGIGVTLRPGMTYRQFADEAAPDGHSARFEPGETIVTVRRAALHGRVCTLDLHFRSQRAGTDVQDAALTRVRIFAHLEGDGSDWSDWTLEQEMRRKREHDALALDLFGQALTPRPIEVNGKDVKPMFPDEQWPRAARFPWGEVVSGYDSKGGQSVMWVAWHAGA